MVASLRASRSSALFSALLMTALGTVVLAGVIEVLRNGATLRDPLADIAGAGAPFGLCLVAIDRWQDFAKPRTLEIGRDGLCFGRCGQISRWSWSEIDEVKMGRVRGGATVFTLRLATNTSVAAPREVMIGGDWAQDAAEVGEFFSQMRILCRAHAAPVA